MKTRTIFYFVGFLAFANGLLVLGGFELPKRDGTIIENSFEYGIETMAIGVVIIILTAILSFVAEMSQSKQK